VNEIPYNRPAILDLIPRDRHAVIEAGAGTGKTWLIEHLVVDRLLTTPCTIEQILVMTFTEKATAELRSRIRGLLETVLAGAAPIDGAANREPGAIDEERRRKLEAALFSFDRVPIYTIHGFCRRELTELAFDSGVRFQLDLVDSRRAFHRAFRAELREGLATDESSRRLLAQWLERKDAAARENLINSLEDLLHRAHVNRYQDSGPISDLPAGEPALEVQAVNWLLPRVVERLEREKREQGQIDYDDMLAWMWRAIEGPRGAAILAALRARFRYALIDEFQDTDDLQWKILRRVFVESGRQSFLYVVGDPKQAIYAFRGADVFSYLQARRELAARDAETVPLTRNFRSTADLIEAANLILDRKAGSPIFTGTIEYDRPAKCGRPELRATDSTGPIKPITILQYAPAAGRGSAARMRAAIGRRIASTLHRILCDERYRITIADRGEKPRRVEANDVYILTRSGAESLEIGGYLRERGVPFAFYKQDGLFQTNEASDIVDVLSAIAEPARHSRRLKAWMSPFFAVPFAQLAQIGELAPDHPLIERLFEWKVLADEERFVELFDHLLHQSGLVDRELFLSNSERELTNYLHIFEILLQEALRERLSIREIIARLQSYIAEAALPPGADSNVQRIESERRAVQVMTVHMSKGLEADVVFLFGGTGRPPDLAPVAIYHAGDARRLAIGKGAKDSARDAIKSEDEQESQRLIYVALTRARVKLYLPFLPTGSTLTRINGYYTRLNGRLEELLADQNHQKSGALARLFEVEPVHDPDPDSGPPTNDLAARLASWSPPASLTNDDQDGQPERFFDQLRERHAPLVTCSYTTLERARSTRWEVEPEDFKYDLETAADSGDLPGGRNVGIFLHEVIEKLDLASLAEPIDLAAWKKLAAVERLFAATMRRYQVRDQRWFDRGAEVVFNALRATIAVRPGESIGPLYRCPSVREMEFIYPIPEAAHALLSTGGDGAWTVERGYLKGFVDFVFEQGGATYFADWKSDRLPVYAPSAIAAHVARHYDLQAKIYSVGIVRLLGIRNEREYHQRFGGLLYLFIRGMRAGGAGRDGVYFHKPGWSEIVRDEADLAAVVRPREVLF
jgi:exodeoxyribonuclease V beta subunit